jgi:hypothetical protein
MPRRIRESCDTFELRGAEVRVARLRRPCDHPLCAKHDIWIEEGDEYAYVSTGQAYCEYNYDKRDVVEVSR